MASTTRSEKEVSPPEKKSDEEGGCECEENQEHALSLNYSIFEGINDILNEYPQYADAILDFLQDKGSELSCLESRLKQSEHEGCLYLECTACKYTKNQYN